MKRLPYLLVLMILAFVACTTANDAEQAKKAATIDNLKKHVEYLSSDLCEGRKPFSKGAERAVEYLANEMKAIGLKPINGDSYLQDISLVLSNTQCSEIMTLNTPKGKLDLKHNEGFVAFSKRIEDEIHIDKAELVFAGYGIVAPEYGKNDYAGIENPENKVAVVMVNDPGLGSTGHYFKGDTMTYYGRWKYKFEEGARQGLKGVLIIHEDRGAGYPFSVPVASAGSKLYLNNPDNTDYYCALEGWLSNASARELLKRNGYDMDELIAEAKKPDFKPFDLKSDVTVSMKSQFTYNSSPNVVGYIEGSKQDGENIVCIAHWDHLGYGKAIDGDTIINGTTDNATAMAWLLETARAFKALKKQPERSIVFLVPTCEETGLLGSSYYVENPIYPVEKTVAVINLDVIPLWGANNDVTITGFGHSTLDDMVTRLAEKYDRYVMADPEAFNGMFYRSDHLPFMKKGVPAMFAKGWSDNREHGKEWATAKIKDYWANTYHKPTDQMYPETDNYDGLMQEVQLFFDLAYELVTTDVYPQWKPASEFANIR